MKLCKFKVDIDGLDAKGNKVVHFKNGESYIVIHETEEGVDDMGYIHSSAYFFPGNLGIEKKFEGKLFEVEEINNED